MHKRDAVDACVKAPERLQHVVDESRKVTGGFILHSVIDTKFAPAFIAEILASVQERASFER